MKNSVLLSIPFVALLITGCTTSKNAEPRISKESAISYAMETRDLLMGTLMKKVQENGTENALEFCNLNALQLTKSVAEKYKTGIKRTTDHTRNPKNAATADQKIFIQKYRELLAKGVEPKPEVSGKQLYIPIVTSQLCIQCHGNPKTDIKPQTLAKIKQLYPQDQATGYSEKQIRGLFVVDLQ